MIRRQGYRFRLKPTQADAALLRQLIGCSRFVWNGLLAQNTLRYERGDPDHIEAVLTRERYAPAPAPAL